MAAISLFDDLYRELFGPDSEFDAYRLLQGFENKTVESGRALWQLSRRALEVPSVRAILEQEPPEISLAALDAAPDGRTFLTLLRGYLEAWGQRGDRWGWSFPSWIEDPTPVIETLKDYVRQPDRDLEAEMAAQVAERERLVANARQRLRSHPSDVVQRFEFLLHAAAQQEHRADGGPLTLDRLPLHVSLAPDLTRAGATICGGWRCGSTRRRLSVDAG